MCGCCSERACDSPLTFPEVHFISLSSVLYWSGYDQGVWGPGELHLRDSGYLVFGGGLGFRWVGSPTEVTPHFGRQVMQSTRVLETSAW